MLTGGLERVLSSFGFSKAYTFSHTQDTSVVEGRLGGSGDVETRVRSKVTIASCTKSPELRYGQP